MSPPATHREPQLVIAYRCLSLLIVACRCVSLLIAAYRCLSLLVVAQRCLSLHLVAYRCLSLLIVAYPCLSLFVVACPCLSLLIIPNASRSIATQVTGSGHEFTNAAGSSVGELANFWKGSLRENRCQIYFICADGGSHLVIVKSQKGTIISFV